MKQQGRNNAIDLSKFVASILVVGIHATPFLDYSETISFIFSNVICRIAVPFFIICSGYYMGKNMGDFTYFKNSWKKYILIYGMWSLIYLPLLIISWIKAGWFSMNAFVGWGIMTLKDGSYYHLWYLLCLIYAFPISYFLVKKINEKYIPLIIFLLYGIEVLQYGYRLFLPVSIQSFFTIFDFLDCALVSITRVTPLLLLGVMVAKQNYTINNKISLFGFIIFLILWMVEAFILRNLGQVQFSYIICTLPTSYFLFNYIKDSNKYLINFDYKLLGKVSTIIYLLHPMILYLLSFIDIQSYTLQFILAVFLSSALGLVYIKVLKM